MSTHKQTKSKYLPAMREEFTSSVARSVTAWDGTSARQTASSWHPEVRVSDEARKRETSGNRQILVSVFALNLSRACGKRDTFSLSLTLSSLHNPFCQRKLSEPVCVYTREQSSAFMPVIGVEETCARFRGPFSINLMRAWDIQSWLNSSCRSALVSRSGQLCARFEFQLVCLQRL